MANHLGTVKFFVKRFRRTKFPHQLQICYKLDYQMIRRFSAGERKKAASGEKSYIAKKKRSITEESPRWCSCDNKWLFTIYPVTQKKTSAEGKILATTALTGSWRRYESRLFTEKKAREWRKINTQDKKELEIWKSSTLLPIHHLRARQFIILISCGDPAFNWETFLLPCT